MGKFRIRSSDKDECVEAVKDFAEGDDTENTGCYPRGVHPRLAALPGTLFADLLVLQRKCIAL